MLRRPCLALNHVLVVVKCVSPSNKRRPVHQCAFVSPTITKHEASQDFRTNNAARLSSGGVRRGRSRVGRLQVLPLFDGADTECVREDVPQRHVADGDEKKRGRISDEEEFF